MCFFDSVTHPSDESREKHQGQRPCLAVMSQNSLDGVRSGLQLLHLETGLQHRCICCLAWNAAPHGICTLVSKSKPRLDETGRPNKFLSHTDPNTATAQAQPAQRNGPCSISRGYKMAAKPAAQPLSSVPQGSPGPFLVSQSSPGLPKAPQSPHISPWLPSGFQGSLGLFLAPGPPHWVTLCCGSHHRICSLLHIQEWNFMGFILVYSMEFQHRSAQNICKR